MNEPFRPPARSMDKRDDFTDSRIGEILARERDTWPAHANPTATCRNP